jgi:hypothetical protein
MEQAFAGEFSTVPGIGCETSKLPCRLQKIPCGLRRFPCLSGTGNPVQVLRQLNKTAVESPDRMPICKMSLHHSLRAGNEEVYGSARAI